MRIIAGIARGRSLEAPQGVATRPTSDRVREAMFSAIEARLDLSGAQVLDLFAGTGALGLEAVSRGAVRAVFVDHSPDCERLILRNGSSIGFAEAISVICTDVVGALAQLTGQGLVFDLVLADPPYADAVDELLDEISRSRLLEEGGLLVLEHAKQRRAPEACGELRLLHGRRYGDTAVSFFTRSDGGDI